MAQSPSRPPENPPEHQPLSTSFGPAERATPKAIRQQVQTLRALPRLAQLYDAVPDFVMILNAQRQLVFANAALLAVLGTDRENFAGGERPGEFLDCERSTLTPGGCGTSEFCSTCGAVQVILSSLRGTEAIQECRIVQRDGGALDFRVWASPLAVDGQAYSIVVAKDISSEKRRQVLERVFFHDLLNMLGIVVNATEMIKHTASGSEAYFADMAYVAAGRIADLIAAQRQLTRAENYELVVYPVPVNVLDLLRSLATACQVYPIAEDRQVLIDPDAAALEIVSDKTLLSRVVENMIKNALEAIRPGQSVTLSCRKRGRRVEITVHNPGHIPRNDQLQIFQRSFSTKAPDRGVGTYSMRLLSERYLRGKVSFRTSAKHGTTFFASYPLSLV